MALTGTVEHSTAFSLTGSPPDGANAWDGTGAHTVVLSGIASAAQGGTGIEYFTAAGPTVARIYTFPDAAATILYSGGALGTPSSGVLTNATGLPVSGLANGTDGELITWDASGVAATVAVGTATHVLTSNGVGVAPTFQAIPASSATLDGITAAAADQAGIANADWNIRWNWQKVTDSEVALEFGETAAATNGTSTSGIPNQVLAKFSTLAASTMSPLSVYSRAVHVFSVSPTTAQILATSGVVTAPAYGFAADVDTGMYLALGYPSFAVNGVKTAVMANTGLSTLSGTAAAPSVSDGVIGFGTAGLFFASSILGISVAAIENSRFIAGAFQASKGTADAVAYALNARKSRGTVAAPTVITTGDDLLTISGYGYVGATNTYQEAARITFDSTGTISDATTGIGGIISFLHATVGAEPVVVAQMKSQHIIHSGTAPTITANGGTDPAIVGTDESFVVTIGTGGVATSVEVTFGNAFTTNPPSVSVESDTDIVPFKITPLTTKVTITATLAFTAGSKLYCIARGWE